MATVTLTTYSNYTWVTKTGEPSHAIQRGAATFRSSNRRADNTEKEPNLFVIIDSGVEVCRFDLDTDTIIINGVTFSGTYTALQIAVNNAFPALSKHTEYTPTDDIPNTLVTGISITGIAIPIYAGKRYRINGILGLGCSGTGGVTLGTNHTVMPASLFLSVIGKTSTFTLFQQIHLSLTQGYNQVYIGTGDSFDTQASANAITLIDGIIVGGATDSIMTFLFASKTATQTSTIYKDKTVIQVTEL